MRCQLFVLLSFWLVIERSTAQSHGESDVTFRSNGSSLAATLFLPKTGRAVGAVAVTHGSGREGRRDAGYRSLASLLVSQGLAVLIFDKRGVGNSEGTYVETPDLEFAAADLIEAVNYLKSRSEIDSTRIGVYGHSQGAWVATRVAAHCRDVSFLAVSCGGAITLREQVLYHTRENLIQQGYHETVADSIVSFGEVLYRYLASGTDYSRTRIAYDAAMRRSWFQFFRAMHFGEQLPPPSMLNQAVFDFFRHIDYDPVPDLNELRIPTLVLLAALDKHVPTDKVNAAWAEEFNDSKKEFLTIRVLAGEDHYCFGWKEGRVIYKDSYAAPLLQWLARFR